MAQLGSGGEGGSKGGGGVCVCVYLIHVVVQHKPIQHCKAIIFQLKIYLKKRKKSNLSHVNKNQLKNNV